MTLRAQKLINVLTRKTVFFIITQPILKSSNLCNDFIFFLRFILNKILVSLSNFSISRMKININLRFQLYPQVRCPRLSLCKENMSSSNHYSYGVKCTMSIVNPPIQSKPFLNYKSRTIHCKRNKFLKISTSEILNINI